LQELVGPLSAGRRKPGYGRGAGTDELTDRCSKPATEGEDSDANPPQDGGDEIRYGQRQIPRAEDSQCETRRTARSRPLALDRRRRIGSQGGRDLPHWHPAPAPRGGFWYRGRGADAARTRDCPFGHRGRNRGENRKAPAYRRTYGRDTSRQRLR